MATSRGKQLAQVIRQNVEGLKQLCLGVDEKLASRAPAGMWSPKKILSHLCGPENGGRLTILQAIVDSDTPRIDLEIGNPFFTENRARMTLGALVAECESNYLRIAEFVEGLTEEQLARKAYIPELKESPLGEYPTLDGVIFGLAEYHVQDHTNHLREIMTTLSAAA